MIASSFAAIGFPSNILCQLQGGVTFFFFRASWIFTTILSYNIYSMVLYQHVKISKKSIHLFVWVSSIILEIIPFSTRDKYGQDDVLRGQALCSIEGGENDELASIASDVWISLLYLFPLLISMILMAYFAVRVSLRFRSDATMHNSSVISGAVSMLSLYPIWMIIAWTPALVARLVYLFGLESNWSKYFKKQQVGYILRCAVRARCCLLM